MRRKKTISLPSSCSYRQVLGKNSDCKEENFDSFLSCLSFTGFVYGGWRGLSRMSRFTLIWRQSHRTQCLGRHRRGRSVGWCCLRKRECVCSRVCSMQGTHTHRRRHKTQPTATHEGESLVQRYVRTRHGQAPSQGTRTNKKASKNHGYARQSALVTSNPRCWWIRQGTVEQRGDVQLDYAPADWTG